MVRHTATSVVTIERFIIEQEGRHPQATGKLSGILYDLAVAAKMGALETVRVESPREEAGDRRRRGLTEAESERHPGAGVRVDDACGVADTEDVSRERAVCAQMNGFGQEDGSRQRRQRFEIGREAWAFAREPVEQRIEVVVRGLRDT